VRFGRGRAGGDGESESGAFHGGAGFPFSNISCVFAPVGVFCLSHMSANSRTLSEIYLKYSLAPPRKNTAVGVV